MGYLFSSESVSEGHPDKVADQISDAILDSFLAQDQYSKVVCDTHVSAGQIVVYGQVSSFANVHPEIVARNVIYRDYFGKSEPPFRQSEPPAKVGWICM